jgi:HSP20 family protein
VKFAKGVLTIKGEKQEEREEKKKGFHMQERSFGSFERASTQTRSGRGS